ncbi:hypothetical protein niasHS_006033 [Heterodera schachtii]|uniref:Uncharacterized protein n=1 Tax=Heterodera schachtii TaxID=97005 RepID=A0ABD2JVZ1_HETSC
MGERPTIHCLSSLCILVVENFLVPVGEIVEELRFALPVPYGNGCTGAGAGEESELVPWGRPPRALPSPPPPIRSLWSNWLWCGCAAAAAGGGGGGGVVVMVAVDTHTFKWGRIDQYPPPSDGDDETGARGRGDTCRRGNNDAPSRDY